MMRIVPALYFQGIDYALSVTGEESLYYGGHSMGCTQYLIMLSAKPEYNKKVSTSTPHHEKHNKHYHCRHQVKLGFLLTPPAYMSHAPSIIFQIASWANDIEVFFFNFFGFLDLVAVIFSNILTISDPLPLVWFVRVPSPSRY